MVRKFLEFAIERPALNHIFMLFMLIMSLFAYRDIPKEIFPPSSLDDESQFQVGMLGRVEMCWIRWWYEIWKMSCNL